MYIHKCKFNYLIRFESIIKIILIITSDQKETIPKWHKNPFEIKDKKWESFNIKQNNIMWLYLNKIKRNMKGKIGLQL